MEYLGCPIKTLYSCNCPINIQGYDHDYEAVLESKLKLPVQGQ